MVKPETCGRLGRENALRSGIVANDGKGRRTDRVLEALVRQSVVWFVESSKETSKSDVTGVLRSWQTLHNLAINVRES
jgi:hypothetical protein